MYTAEMFGIRKGGVESGCTTLLLENHSFQVARQSAIRIVCRTSGSWLLSLNRIASLLFIVTAVFGAAK